MSGDSFPGLPSDQPIRMERRYRTVTQRTLVALTTEEIAENKQYASSLKVLRSDESEAAKQSARDALRQLLVKRFTRDLLSRENDLVELESRVKKLREQLDKRIAAKDQIVELQLTTIQNEIDGLGFDGFSTPEVDVKFDDFPTTGADVRLEVNTVVPRDDAFQKRKSESKTEPSPKRKPKNDELNRR